LERAWTKATGAWISNLIRFSLIKNRRSRRRQNGIINDRDAARTIRVWGTPLLSPWLLAGAIQPQLSLDESRNNAAVSLMVRSGNTLLLDGNWLRERTCDPASDGPFLYRGFDNTAPGYERAGEHIENLWSGQFNQNPASAV
jgi:hypothetical protein